MESSRWNGRLRSWRGGAAEGPAFPLGPLGMETEDRASSRDRPPWALGQVRTQAPTGPARRPPVCRLFWGDLDLWHAPWWSDLGGLVLAPGMWLLEAPAPGNCTEQPGATGLPVWAGPGLPCVGGWGARPLREAARVGPGGGLAVGGSPRVRPSGARSGWGHRRASCSHFSHTHTHAFAHTSSHLTLLNWVPVASPCCAVK